MKEMSTVYPVVHGSLKNYFYYLVRFKRYFIHYCKLLWQALKGSKDIKHAIDEENRNIAMRKWLKG